MKQHNPRNNFTAVYAVRNNPTDLYTCIGQFSDETAAHAYATVLFPHYQKLIFVGWFDPQLGRMV